MSRNPSITIWGLALPAFALLGACGGSVSGADSKYIDDAGPLSDGTTLSDGGSTGLPCDVAGVLAKCTSCHSNPPTSGTPMALVTYDDLMKASVVDATANYAQRSVIRMKDTKSPMPPGTTPAASDIAILEAWIAAGSPKGACGSADSGPNPYDTPPTCTSGTKWTRGDNGSGNMHPGSACIACHASGGGEAPLYTIAGTVYPTAHEPTDCNSILSGTAMVVVTDATGKVVNINVNAVGNFYSRTAITTPYTAKVTYQGRERIMVAGQTSGDCNTCHTEKGTSSAPGRIMLP